MLIISFIFFNTEINKNIIISDIEALRIKLLLNLKVYEEGLLIFNIKFPSKAATNENKI